MSLNDHQGAGYAFRELMRRAAAEIATPDGELKPARVLHGAPTVRLKPDPTPAEPDEPGYGHGV